MKLRSFYWLLIAATFTGCASIAMMDLTALYGPAEPRERIVTDLPASNVDYWTQAKPVIDSRCTVCHSCYDAACQLKMSSIEGITRGSSHQIIYDQTRLTAAPLSRLFEDAEGVAAWREKGFYPVLNEHADTPEANREASLIYKMLALKHHNPLPADKVLNDTFDLSLDRQQSCPKAEEFPQYALDFPLGGMPYALPGLNNNERAILMRWVEEGGVYTPRKPLENSYQQRITRWENYFNADTNKQKLISRYMYEHLFVAHLYFDDLVINGQRTQYFKLVRSSTPPGEPIEIIASRRPFDDPKVDRTYYRLQRELASVVAKTHMPYALGENRLARWNSLFNDLDYNVTKLPGYDIKMASNPFQTFAQLPLKSRYQFMLDEARYTISGFIKGPVCRGSVALGVINDNFWVFFSNPDSPIYDDAADFLAMNSDNFELPASKDSNIYRPLAAWRHYSKLQTTLLSKKDEYLASHLSSLPPLSLAGIWDGDDNNPNAALTVFRHNDSASVEKGLIGESPKTAWVIGFSLLERLHYLLVAGYDVYGNVGHQLITRTYMDFLRMEGEANFLALLPPQARQEERDNWYRQTTPEIKSHLTLPIFESNLEIDIDYQTDNEKIELYQLIAQKLTKVLPDTVAPAAVLQQLGSSKNFPVKAIAQLPQMAIVQITDQQQRHYFTLLHNNEHSSMTSILWEQNNRLPEEDHAVFVEGIVGSYPNAFYRLEMQQLGDFLTAIANIDDDDSYSQFLDRFGVRRTHPDFWAFSDQLHTDYQSISPTTSGLLDYNRLENR